MPDIVTRLEVDASDAARGVQAFAKDLDTIGAAMDAVIKRNDTMGRAFNSAGIQVFKSVSSAASSLDGLLRGMDAAYATSRQFEQAQERLARSLEKVDALYRSGLISAEDASRRQDILTAGVRQLIAAQAQFASGAITAADAQQAISDTFTSGTRAVAGQRKEYEALAAAAAEAAAEQARFTRMGDEALMNAVSRQKATNGAFIADQHQQRYNAMLGVDSGPGASAQESAAAFQAADAAAARFVASVDPATAAERAFGVAAQEAQELLAGGLITQQQYTRGLAAMREELDRVRLASSPVAAGQAAFFGDYQSALMGAVDQQKAANGAFRADQYQKAINARLGVRDIQGGSAAAAASAFSGGSDDANRYLTSLDKEYAALVKLREARDGLRNALAGVRVLQDQEGAETAVTIQREQLLAQKLAQVEEAYNGAAAGTITTTKALLTLRDIEGAAGDGMNKLQANMARMEAIHVGRATFDSLAAGIPVTQTLAMESGRVAQILTEIPGILAPIATGAALAAPFVLLALAASQAKSQLEETNRVLALTGGSAGLTSSAFTAMAAHAGDAAGLSRSSALSIQQVYAATGTIAGSMLGKLTGITKEWAKATGQSAEDAGKQLAGIFADPTKGAQDLNKITHSIGLEEMTRIEGLQRAGDLYGAQDRLLQNLLGRLKEIAGLKPAKDGLLDRLGNWASNAWTAVGKAVDTGARTTDERIADIQYTLTRPLTERVRAPLLRQLEELKAKKAAEEAAALTGKQQADAVELGNTVRPIIDPLLMSQRAQLEQQLQALDKAQATIDPSTNRPVLSDEQAAAARQRITAQIASLRTPYQNFLDQQKIDRRVAAAPPGERDALRARLTAENQASTWDVSDDQRKAMINGADTAAILDQTRAYKDHADALDRDAAARRRIAEAYSRSLADGQRQEVVESVDRDIVASPYGLAPHRDEEISRRLNAQAASSAADLQRQLATLRQNDVDQAALYGNGDAAEKDTAAIQARTMAQKAMNDAIAAGDTTLQGQIGAMQEETEALLRNAEVRTAQAKLRQDLTTLQAQGDGLRSEAQYAGMDAEQRAVLNARLEEEKRLRTELGALYDDPRLKPQINGLLDQAGDNARYKANEERMKREQQEFTGVIQGGIDAISNGFEGFMIRGQSAAATFKNIWVDVFDTIAKEAIKLSITNPLMNALGLGGMGKGGGQLPTLFGGSGGAAGGGGIFGGGLLSSLGKDISGWLFGSSSDVPANALPNGAEVEGVNGTSLIVAASGGHITGPGTGTSDSIPARLSNGEFVVNAAATSRHLDLLHAINDNRISAFADGGAVGRPVNRYHQQAAAAAPPAATGGVQVNVHNYASSDTEVQTRPNASGAGLDLVLTKKSQGDFNGGKMDRSMRSNYGLARTPNLRS